MIDLLIIICFSMHGLFGGRTLTIYRLPVSPRPKK